MVGVSTKENLKKIFKERKNSVFTLMSMKVNFESEFTLPILLYRGGKNLPQKARIFHSLYGK